MHIRPKPWARPELEDCGFFISDPTSCPGKWCSFFDQIQPIHMELGCGKGTFIAAKGIQNPDINYIAVDMIDAVLGLSKRTIAAVYGERPVDNIRLIAYDIERINQMMNTDDPIERIYINFCNPWPKRRHYKKRLTHTRQLEKYKEFMTPGSEIYFKTDDDALFEASLGYFEAAGFQVITLIRDLHASDFKDNIVTEHEQMFSNQGIPIKFAIARLH
ncbi:MAG: tRNA (guanosine(46)-N7)-methyltransferase TrmB [Eubacterium sp.]